MTSIAPPGRRTALTLLSLLVLIGCPNTDPSDDDDSGEPSHDDDDIGDDDDNLDDDDTTPEPLSCERMAFVEVLAVDLFGRLIETASGVPPIEEPNPGAHQLQIEAPDYSPVTLSFSIGEEGVPDSVAVSVGVLAGVQRERVIGVWHAVAVIVLIQRVGDAVAVEVGSGGADEPRRYRALA